MTVPTGQIAPVERFEGRTTIALRAKGYGRAAALPPSLRETAYALACDLACADGKPKQHTLRLLEVLRDRLHLEPLVTAAIERAAQARYRTA